MGPDRLDIDRIQRLAGGHEQTVSAWPTKADIRADFRQADHANAIAIRRKHLHAGSCAGPDVPVGITSHTVGGRRRARTRNVELHEASAVEKPRAIDIPYLDVARHPRVSNVE